MKNDTRIGPEHDLALREGLQVNELSAAALARIRAATEAEWRLNTRRPARRWRYAMAASALVVGIAGAFLFFDSLTDASTGGDLAAHLVRFDAPGVVETRMLARDIPLTEGAVLRSGHTYRMLGQSLLAVEGGGNVRVSTGTEIEIVARDDFRLNRGELYVDIPRGQHASAAFVARTTAGEFRHVGTQFALAVDRGQTRLRVREGAVRWLAAAGESTVEAGSEVVFAGDAKISVRPIASSDKDWDWTAQMTPEFEIDNRPLGEFLEWVARESGRKLVLADSVTTSRVATIRMHGSVHGLTPLQALSAVMAATELRYDLPDGQIRVSFAGEPTPSR